MTPPPVCGHAVLGRVRASGCPRAARRRAPSSCSGCTTAAACASARWTCRAQGSVRGQPRLCNYGDQTFRVNERVNSEFDWRSFDLTWLFSFIRNDRFELGTGIGMHFIQAETSAAVPARGVQRVLRRFRAVCDAGAGQHLAHHAAVLAERPRPDLRSDRQLDLREAVRLACRRAIPLPQERGAGRGLPEQFRATGYRRPPIPAAQCASTWPARSCSCAPASDGACARLPLRPGCAARGRCPASAPARPASWRAAAPRRRSARPRRPRPPAGSAARCSTASR